MRVIMISGKAGSGKNFLASRLKDLYEKYYGSKVAILAFADPLKMIAKQLYDWDGVKGDEGRRLLQTLGTDVVKQTNPTCWARCIVEIMFALRKQFDLFIIPDTRFFHEIETVKDLLLAEDDGNHDVITVRIIGETNLSEKLAEHKSETELDDAYFDYYFPNVEYDMDIFFHNLSRLVISLQGGNISDDIPNPFKGPINSTLE